MAQSRGLHFCRLARAGGESSGDGSAGDTKQPHWGSAREGTTGQAAHPESEKPSLIVLIPNAKQDFFFFFFFGPVLGFPKKV